MKAYKATEKNMQCRDYQFEMNKEFVHTGEIKLCKSGFHFCKDLIDVFSYYGFHSYNKFFEVEIPDDAEVIHGDNKSVTNKIKFIRELSSEDIKGLTSGVFYVNEDGGYVECERITFYNENDELHRADGPAVVYSNGNQSWYQNGKLHRVDGPAIVYADGNQEWFQNGERHRDDGPAIMCMNGYQSWWQNGNLHRVDGPAIVYANGHQEWWQNGERHRVVIWANGDQNFWINGVHQK